MCTVIYVHLHTYIIVLFLSKGYAKYIDEDIKQVLQVTLASGDLLAFGLLRIHSKSFTC